MTDNIWQRGKLVAILTALGIMGVLCACGNPNQEKVEDVNQTSGNEIETDRINKEVAVEEEPGRGDFAVEIEGEKNSVNLEAENSDISIIMVGDILLHTDIEDSARREDGTYNFDFLFDELRDEISAADIAIVNQEVIIGGEELGITGYPSFNAPYEIGDALVNAGFDVICHATNHALDKGKRGILNTCAYWKNAHPELTVVGLNETEAEYENIDILEKNGIRIAILNYSYGTNGIGMPADMPHAVDMLIEEKVISDLKYAEANSDFTIVCPHWGTEYRLEPDSSQKKWTEIFRENGADLVIGTHPHVIEPVELLEDSDAELHNNHGAGDMLVYYSLGNYVNWTSGTGAGVSDRMVGGMARVSIGCCSDGETAIKDFGIEPIVCHLDSAPGAIRVYPLSSYSEELAAKNLIIRQDPAFSYSYCVELCDKVWGDL